VLLSVNKKGGALGVAPEADANFCSGSWPGVASTLEGCKFFDKRLFVDESIAVVVDTVALLRARADDLKALRPRGLPAASLAETAGTQEARDMTVFSKPKRRAYDFGINKGIDRRVCRLGPDMNISPLVERGIYGEGVQDPDIPLRLEGEV